MKKLLSLTLLFVMLSFTNAFSQIEVFTYNAFAAGKNTEVMDLELTSTYETVVINWEEDIFTISGVNMIIGDRILIVNKTTKEFIVHGSKHSFGVHISPKMLIIKNGEGEAVVYVNLD